MKKEDKLEQYIRDNRSSFDDADLSDEFWNKVSGDLNKEDRRKIPWIRISWQVAAAVIIFFSAWYLKDFTRSDYSSQALLLKRDARLHPVIIIKQEKGSPDVLTLNNNVPVFVSTTMAEQVQPQDSLPSELIEATEYYASQISKTRSLMKTCASYNTEIDQQVNVEFAELDTVYKSLQNDLKENINSTEVLEAMILNYRMRLEILQSIMQQLETTADCGDMNKMY